MNLKVLLPTKVYIDQDIVKVVAEAENGSFCLLPRHIDFVAALIPGILSYESVEGQEEFVAVDEGILVKVGQEVLISTRNAEKSSELGKLKETVEKSFQVVDDRERKARSATAKLEADLARKFLELGRHERY